MQTNTITTAPTTVPQPTAAQKLEQARQRIRQAARQIQVSEGRTLDFETAEDIQRTLHTALRVLQELTITLAVMQRKEVRANG